MRERCGDVELLLERFVELLHGRLGIRPAEILEDRVSVEELFGLARAVGSPERVGGLPERRQFYSPLAVNAID